MVRIEEVIVQHLFASEKYCRTVVPFLKPEYFANSTDAHIIEECVKFFTTHNHLPTPTIIELELKNKKGVTDKDIETASALFESFTGEVAKHEWIVEQTEIFCKKRSVYNGIVESIAIMDGQDKNRSDDMIPKILADALAVSFDVQVGHNYLDDAEARFAFYTHTEERIPFDLDMLNKATGGGMVPKALYGVAAQSGGGKSIMMTHVAANTLRQGKNVLYITLEMSEEKIAERIDANLMNVEIDSLKKMTKDEFMTKIDKISSKTHGKLFIKEYPTSGAHVGHFRGLVEELKTKQNFIPDLICIDYLGICLSSRMRMGGSVNTNSYLKSVAEEMRGLAVELNVPILTGIQLNRGSYGSSDVDMSNIADSIGIAMTLDFFFALVQTEDLTALDQVLVQVMKNRYGDIMKFIVGLKKSKMQFYNLEESAQTSLMPRVPDSLKKSPQDSGFGQKKNDVSDWKF